MDCFAQHHSHFIAAEFFGCYFCQPWIFFYMKWILFQKCWLIVWSTGIDPAYKCIDLRLCYGSALRHSAGKNGRSYVWLFCEYFGMCGKRPSRIGAATGMTTTVNGAYRSKYGLYISWKLGADTGTGKSYAVIAARSSAGSITFTTARKHESCWKNSHKGNRYFFHHWNFKVFCYH